MEYEIKAHGKFRIGFKELWTYRELFYFFTWRDIKVKYKQTFFGFAWAILQPVLLMLLFTFFFSSRLNVPSDGTPYPVFVFAGLLLWNIFSSGLANAGNSMVTNANIIKKIYFPRLIVPLSSVLVALFDFLMAFLVFLGLLIYYHQPVIPGLFILALVYSILITTMATFGLGAFLAALNVKYRDFRYVIPFMIQALLFITPVIYPISIVNNKNVVFILNLNPLSGAITLFRSSISGISPDMQSVVIGTMSAIIMLVGGVIYFRKTEAYFADLA